MLKPKLKDFIFKGDVKKHPFHTGGLIFHFDFPNGYGASVINIGYGNEENLLEIAVTEGKALCYDTPITGDVIGNLTIKEVNDYLTKISKLKKGAKKNVKNKNKKNK